MCTWLGFGFAYSISLLGPCLVPKSEKFSVL